MESRKTSNPFSQIDLFLGGDKDVKEECATIKNALLCKDGLVDADKQDSLRSQIETAFSDDVLDKLSEDVQSTVSAQKPHTESIVANKFTLDLFSTNQGKEEVVIEQSKIDRDYICALKKVKPEHAEYYRTLKADLEKHLGSGDS